MQNTRSSADATDEALVRLRRDALDTPAGIAEDADFSDRAPIDFAILEFEVERMRKRLAVWEIFLSYVSEGAQTWPEVQRAVTPGDLEEISRICNGTPLRDVLLELR